MPNLINSLPETPSECKAVVIAELNESKLRDKALEEKLEENTELTKEIIDIVKAMQGGMRVLGWLGSFLKWGVGIAAAIYTIWRMIKGDPV